MIVEIFLFHFSIESLMMDDMAYVMSWQYDIVGLGDGNGFGKLPGISPA